MAEQKKAAPTVNPHEGMAKLAPTNNQTSFVYENVAYEVKDGYLYVPPEIVSLAESHGFTVIPQ